MIGRPDVLVLGAGGALGERWMHGVLAGLADGAGVDLRRVESFVGTSAGALVAAHLLAGRAPAAPADRAAGRETAHGGAADGRATDGRAPADGGDEPGAADGRAGRGLGARALRLGARAPVALAGGAGRVARGVAGAAARPVAPAAMRATAPAGALLRAGVLRQIPPTRASLDEVGRRVARDGLRFDGRLRVVCVERDSGRRVVFGAPGAPAATVAQAIQASCSVPWLHRPVEIDGRAYLDGGLWSPTSIDAAPAGRDTHVLVLNPTAGADAAGPGAIRLASRSAAALEALTLRRRGAQVQIVSPDRAAAAVLAAPLGDDDLAEHALAAGYRQGLELAPAARRPD